MAETRDQREFARIDVAIPARVQPLDEPAARRLRAVLLTRPSVWSLSEEGTLRDLVSRGANSTETVLARSLLELTGQIVKLRGRLLESAPGVKQATVTQLSGGGGSLISELALDIDDLFELQLADDDDEVPPVRALCRVVHYRSAEGRSGYRYEAIHPRDRDRMIRVIYTLQRRELRRAHVAEGA